VTDTQLYLSIGIPALLALVNLGVVLSLFTHLDGKIQGLSDRVDGRFQSLSDRVDGLERSLVGAINELDKRLTRVEIKLGI